MTIVHGKVRVGILVVIHQMEMLLVQEVVHGLEGLVAEFNCWGWRNVNVQSKQAVRCLVESLAIEEHEQHIRHGYHRVLLCDWPLLSTLLAMLRDRLRGKEIIEDVFQGVLLGHGLAELVSCPIVVEVVRPNCEF